MHLRHAGVMLMHPIVAQVAYPHGGPGLWLFLLILGGVLGVVVYVLFRAQPPSGPKIGE